MFISIAEQHIHSVESNLFEKRHPISITSNKLFKNKPKVYESTARVIPFENHMIFIPDTLKSKFYRDRFPLEPGALITYYGQTYRCIELDYVSVNPKKWPVFLAEQIA